MSPGDLGVFGPSRIDGRLDIPVIVRRVDDRKPERDDELVDLRGADPLLGHFPVPVHPAAERADAAPLDPIIFGERLIRGARARQGAVRQAELLGHVLDQLAPGGQADAHRQARAGEQDDPTIPDRFGKLVELEMQADHHS
jgi:hypothetical protein